MKKYFCLIIICFISSSCQEKEVKIIPIVDGYAKKNGDIPNVGNYYCENFKDNKDNISKIFNYINDSITVDLPFNKNQYSIHIYKNKRDVWFDDGQVFTKNDLNFNFWISFNETNLEYYNYLRVSSKYSENCTDLVKTDSNTYRDTAEEFSYEYEIAKNNNILKIKMQYNDFRIEILQKFLNIVNCEREKIKNQIGTYHYQLVNTEKERVECTLKYINDPKNNLNNVFKLILN